MATAPYIHKSERLTYRAYEPEHLDFVYSMFKNADRAWESKPRNKERIENSINQVYKKAYLYLIAFAGETPVGTVELHEQHPPMSRTVEFGVLIHPEHTGKGYAQEVTKWTLEWAFVVGGQRKVILETASWNEAAIHVYKKCGYTEEGRRREAVWSEGKWHDSILMGILDREWQANQKSK